MKDSEKAFYQYLKGKSRKEIAAQYRVEPATVASWSQRGINGKKWTELKEECTNDDGSIKEDVVKMYISGKGNLNPVMAGELSPVWSTNNVDRPENRTVIGDSLAACMRWYNKPPVKTDDECRTRLLEYFSTCVNNGEMLTVEKMAMALGIHYATMWDWEQGKRGTVRADLIKNGKQLIWAFEGEMAINGKINPATYCFRAKNFFGMRDVVDTVVTHNNPLGAQENKESLQARIMSLSDDEG